MNLKQLEAFRALMIAGSATGAGELLRVTQPAISRLLNQFERETKLRLFERSGGRLVPTPEAQQLLDEVESVFGAVRRVKERAKALADTKVGHLRVVALPTLSLSFLPEAVSAFLAARPDVTATLNIRGSSQVADWVASQEADIGFAALPTENPGVTVETFQEHDGVCIMAQDHHLASKPVIRAADLEGERFVSLAAGTISRLLTDQMFIDRKVNRKIVVETHYATAACAFVANGVGVGIVDPITAQSFADRGVVARPFEPTIRFGIGMLFPARKPQTLLVQEFVSALMDFKKLRTGSMQAEMGRP